MLKEDELLLFEHEAIVHGNTSNPQSLKVDRHLHNANIFLKGHQSVLNSASFSAEITGNENVSV